MTETADQILSHVVPNCQWVLQTSIKSSSTASAYPLFPDDVREWIQFFRGVRLARIQYPLPVEQFPVFQTEARPLRIEKDAEDRFRYNVLSPVDKILKIQGAIFHRRYPELLGVPDFVLGTNNPIVAKMPIEMKTRFNLNLCGHNLWTIYRHAQRDHNFKFRKAILSQIFGAMACNGFHYGILSNYSDTYFLKREETNQTTLYVSRVVQPNDVNPTLRECVYYISQLAINDNFGKRLDYIKSDNILINGFDDDADDTDNSFDDNPDDSNYTDDNSSGDNVSSNNYDDDYPSKKMKRGSKKAGSSKKVITSSSKGITIIDEYIGGGTFGKVFSGLYHD
ncbi:hypothetical protein Glove_194g7 [Diversispora epigaea]|uniref:Uncharacterized protein n=1 Tax=Diversispora epigaea TaxID=1348612 RepID=A0A397ISE0_9GLOM|nr:hypothetical protein Glove_194g7 [Diversispora epigaea]